MPLRAKLPGATSVQDPREPSAAPHSPITAVYAAASDTPRGTSHIAQNDSAAQASPCPSLPRPSMARITASPGGTAVLLISSCPSFQCQSWHHLGPSTPSSYL